MTEPFAGVPQEDQDSPPPFGAGHQVVYLPTGETWTVDGYVPPTTYRPASLLLGRSSADDGVARATIMDVDPGHVQLVVTPGRAPWPPYAYGDLVEDLLTGETWNVEHYIRAGPRRAAQVTLFRDHPGTGTAEVHTADTRELRLLVPWTGRSVFPGDGWSDRPPELRTPDPVLLPGEQSAGDAAVRSGFPEANPLGGQPRELTEEQELVLGLEGRPWRSEGEKNQVALAEHGISVTRYYQVLAGLADSPAAYRANPALINRLRERRNVRGERRSPRL